MRNEITRDKRNSKKSYNTDIFEKNKNKSSQVWQNIRKLVNVKAVKSSRIKLMMDKNIVNDSTEISNVFNNHFSTLGSKVQQKIPIERGSYNSYLYKKNKNGKFFINPDGQVFFLSPTDKKEVSDIIGNLNEKSLLVLIVFLYFYLKSSKIFFHYGFLN